MGERGVIEPDPIRVVENRDSAERFHKFLGRIKIKGDHSEPITKGIRTVNRVRKGNDVPTLCEQSLSDIFPGVPEGSSYRMDILTFHPFLSRANTNAQAGNVRMRDEQRSAGAIIIFYEVPTKLNLCALNRATSLFGRKSRKQDAKFGGGGEFDSGSAEREVVHVAAGGGVRGEEMQVKAAGKNRARCGGRVKAD